jgi:hypothetical protein
MQTEFANAKYTNTEIIDVILKCLATADRYIISDESVKASLDFVTGNKSKQSDGALIVALLMFAQTKEYMSVKY